MNTKQTMSLLTITIAGLAVSAASAATVTWEGDINSSWNTAGNWDTGNVPGAGDDVIIPDVATDPQLDVSSTVNSIHIQSGGNLSFKNAQTLTVDAGGILRVSGIFNINRVDAVVILEKADALDIDSGGVVEISQDADLRLTAASSSGNPIDGELRLSASGARFQVQDDNTFTGSGSIVGSDAVKVEISANRTFTTQVDVVGRMQVDGLSPVNPGVFKLDSGAMVHANVSGEVIEFMADTVLADSGTEDAELFKASNGGELMFSKTATDLAAAFEIDGGVFDFDQDISTSGDLTCSSPTIEVAMGKVFTWLFGRTGQDSLDDSGSPYTTCP